MLTAKQQQKFYNFIREHVSNDSVTSAYFDTDERSTNKYEKMGLIAIVETDERENSFRLNGDKRLYTVILTDNGLELAKQLYGDYVAMVKASNREENKCWKCNGKGYIPEYGHVENGVCFECNGNGKTG